MTPTLGFRALPRRRLRLMASDQPSKWSLTSATLWEAGLSNSTRRSMLRSRLRPTTPPLLKPPWVRSDVIRSAIRMVTDHRNTLGSGSEQQHKAIDAALTAAANNTAIAEAALGQIGCHPISHQNGH